jgi:argininosuccinate lyase
MIAYAQGIVIQCHNIPFGDTQDIEDEIFPTLFGSLETSGEVFELYGAVLDTLHVNVEHLRARAIAGFTTVTELADTLVREANLPFRQAHSIVSGMVTHALKYGLQPSDFNRQLLGDIAEASIGRRIELSDAMIQRALDPQAFVEARIGIGGAAPSATRAVLEQQAEGLRTDQSWLHDTFNRLENADTLLAGEVEKILTGTE